MVLEEEQRDFLVFVNEQQVLRFPTELPEGDLYLVIDLLGSVEAVTLNNKRPPKCALKARNLVKSVLEV